MQKINFGTLIALHVSEFKEKPMNNGYYTATGAMVTQFNRLNVISNNLANVNTTAFKQDNVVIGDFERIYQEKRDNLAISDHTKKAAKFLNRSIDRVPQISQDYIDFKQSGVRHTGNTFDFSLKRQDAFFVVKTPQGLRLTQNGSFTLNNAGNLVTKEGYDVLPSSYQNNNTGRINIPENSRVSVDRSGNFYVDDEATEQFYMVVPSDIRRLEKEGNNLYKFEDERDLDVLNEDDVVSQGYIETSNVNPVRQMTQLIETSRLVGMYQKVMTTHMEDLNSDAITKLATPK